MLTRDEVFNTVDAHLQAMLSMVSHGHHAEAAAMLKGLTDLIWEVTRPDAEYRTKNVSYAIPDEYRSEISELVIHVVTDEDGKALMAWGEALDNDGNDIVVKGKVTKEMHGTMMAVIDETMEEHFGHIDRSKVTSMYELEKRWGESKTPMTTAHIEVTKEAIDQAAAEFNDEFDRLFETWGGGEQ